MAAKLLHSLTDDNPDLQKQIGCMTGVFQLFDRHHIIAGRRIAGHSPKRLPPGSSQFNNGTPERESSNIYQRPNIVEKHSNKSVQDKHRISTESSRDSFSSLSRSSSFSSVDCNITRTTHPDPDQIMFPETPSREPAIRQSSASPQMGRQSLDLRDVVKDSMYREARGLSHKTTAREDKDHVMNYRESLTSLAKLQEANWYDEPRELSRSKSYQFKDGSSFSISKDCPRFSYDGRETNHLSFESQDAAKTTNTKQLKELPRLSLDSRESSMRSLHSVSVIPNKASDPNSNLLSRNSRSDSVMSVDEGPIQTRPTSIVAKLMGLDTLPDSASAAENKLRVGPIRTQPAEDLSYLSRSSVATNFCGPIKMSNSSRSSLREPTSPCWKNTDMKPISRFPIEPAPWKQRDGARSPHKLSSRVTNSPIKTHSPFSSVYREVERRSKYLEFQSGKDLRALKHILEAMQSMEMTKGGREDTGERYSIATQNARFSDQGRSQGDHQNPSSGNKGSNSSRSYESPIVIMKPATLVEKSAVGASSVIQVDGFSVDNRKVSTNRKAGREQIPKATRRETVTVTVVKAGGRQARAAQSSTRQQQVTKESTTSLVKSSGSVSPRLLQKRLASSRPPTPPADSSRLRKQSNKQQSESSSPGGRRRPKYPNIQQSDDQDDEVCSESKKMSYGDIQAAQQSYCDVHPKMDREVTTSEFSEEIDCSSISIQESTLPLREDESLAPEYPSPVSVLDDAVYMDESPSPVKHMPKTLKDDATQNLSDKFDEEWEAADDVSVTITPGITSEINRQKLQNIEHLVQKLRRLNSSHDEAQTDYIASLCENTKPDDRYISEILLASGLLLRDLGSSLTTFQFHSSGHPINPELFLVLEQTKFSNLPKESTTPDKVLKKEKHHRKLIFDTVNEILVGKLALVGPSLVTWSRKPFKLAKKTLNAQKLLRDLCLEIEQLQVQKKRNNCSLEEEDDGLKSILWEDVLSRSECWTDYDGEIPVITLEVERLIFKDLVNEVVMGEAADGRRAKTGRRCRQLFSK